MRDSAYRLALTVGALGFSLFSLAACSADDAGVARHNGNQVSSGSGGSGGSGGNPGGGWHPGTGDAGATNPPPGNGGSGGTGGSGNTGGSGGSGGGGNGGGGSTTDAGGTTPPPPPPPQFTTYDVQIGPIALNPGQETVVCITKHLGNADPVFVPHLTAKLAPGSHHIIAYRTTAAENLTPTPCQSFQGILLGSSAPIMISQRADDELTFPSGIALKIQPNQGITLEAHYINTGSSPLMGQGNLGIDTVPANTEGVIESDIAFWGTEQINVPAGSSASTGVLFQKGIKDTHGFALTTHQHRMGTGFKIWFAKNAQDSGKTMLANSTTWQDPPLYPVDPQMVTFDGSNGLAYQCDWKNTSSSQISFGESALNEMCFLWMYYYPSHGFDGCGVQPCFR